MKGANSAAGAGVRSRLAAWWNRPDSPSQNAPLLSHLAALRRTILVGLVAVLAGFLVAFLAFSKALVNAVTAPLLEEGIQIIFTGVSEAFGAQTKLSLIVGILAASPVLVSALWLFIRPALRRKERILAGTAVLAGLLLFFLGIWFAYRYVFFLAVTFFVYSGEGVAEPLLSVGTYINFLFGFLLPFGVMFELPVVLVVLTRMGLVETRALHRCRKYIIFSIFLLAAVLTPPDVISQVLLAGPLWVLFEVGVLLSWLVRPRALSGERAQTGGRQGLAGKI